MSIGGAQADGDDLRGPRLSGALERRAVAAAQAVAAAEGLAVREPVVIHSGSNVLVHLRPAPVVARVMSGTVVIHDDPRRWLEREVAVLEFLAPTGLAVRPSREIAPGPHRHDGLWLTFTELVEDLRPGLDPRAAVSVEQARGLGRSLRALHDALEPYAGDLGTAADLEADIRRLLGHVVAVDARRRDALELLGESVDAVRATVFDSQLPVQALHGDVSLTNLLRAGDRAIWNDLEDALRGPVHWDVSSIVSDVRARGGGPRAVAALLDAYGWEGEERELAPFIAAHDAYDAIWGMYDRQRRAQ